MLSLVVPLQPHAPGVRASTDARRVPHLVSEVTERPAAADDAATKGEDAARREPRAPLAVERSRLAELAEQIRQLQERRRPPASRCPSGLPALDDVLGGGFINGAVHELITTEEGVAALSLALRVAANAAGNHADSMNEDHLHSTQRWPARWIVYIDTQGDLYPPGATQLGVSLERLVVVRAPRATDALWVCEQTLRCGAVAAVVCPLRTIDAYASRRLQLAAEAGDSLGLLVCSAAAGGPTFAASRLQCEAGIRPSDKIHLPLQEGVGRGTEFPSGRRTEFRAAGPPGGRRLWITVLKLREGRPCGPVLVEWPDAADFVPAHAVSGGGTRASRRGASG